MMPKGQVVDVQGKVVVDSDNDDGGNINDDVVVVLPYVDHVAEKVLADADTKVDVVDDNGKEDMMTDLCCPSSL